MDNEPFTPPISKTLILKEPRKQKEQQWQYHLFIHYSIEDTTCDTLIKRLIIGKSLGQLVAYTLPWQEKAKATRKQTLGKNEIVFWYWKRGQLLKLTVAEDPRGENRSPCKSNAAKRTQELVGPLPKNSELLNHITELHVLVLESVLFSNKYLKDKFIQ